MKVASRGVQQALAESRQSITERWLEQALGSYPGPVSRFLLQEKDPFHNPVGQAFREGLPVLVAELAGEMDPGRLRAALDGIVRIRAVQDFSASQAVAFVFLLRKVIREELRFETEALAWLEDRIDELALVAFDLYTQCREQLSQIRTQEARRRVYVHGKLDPAQRENGP